MKKKLTEREAWALLAEKWSKPFEDWEGDCAVDLGDGFGACNGLCVCIDDLCFADRIKGSVMSRMLNAVPDPEGDEVYLWPLNYAGARKRARFCRAQVRRLTRKKVKSG